MTLRVVVTALVAAAATGCGSVLGGGMMGPDEIRPVGPRIELGQGRVFGGDGGTFDVLAQENTAGGWCYQNGDGSGSCNGGAEHFGPSGVGGWGASSGGGRSCFNMPASLEVTGVRVEAGGQTVTLAPLERSAEVLGHHLFAGCFAWDLDWETATFTAIHADGSEHAA